MVINPKLFSSESFNDRMEDVCETLRNAPKAKGSNRIYTPGEIEWSKHKVAQVEGLTLTPDVETSLRELSEESGIALKLI